MRTYTMAEIKQANKAAGLFFFEGSTLRFFGSRISNTVYQGIGGVFFVTSERRDYTTPRLYTVRQFWPDEGEIDTVGGFQEFSSRKAAVRCARMLAKLI